MSEKGILFSQTMIEAIRDGRKSMTRRPVKRIVSDNEIFGIGIGNPTKTDKDGEEYPGRPVYAVWGDGWHIPCRYQVGDLLYVKETYAIYQTVNYMHLHDGRSFSEVSDGQIAYRADGFTDIKGLKDLIRLISDSNESVEVSGWKSPMYMPKKYARIWLEVTDVKAERVQDITEEDAKAEGVTYELAYECNDWKPTFYDPDSGGGPDYIAGFKNIWDGLYGSDPVKGWEANPMVFAISFRVLVGMLNQGRI
jgi:hypothetical protein